MYVIYLWPINFVELCLPTSKNISAFSGLLDSLEEVRPQLQSDEEDFGFLSGLLGSRELQALVQVHNKVWDFY